MSILITKRWAGTWTRRGIVLNSSSHCGRAQDRDAFTLRTKYRNQFLTTPGKFSYLLNWRRSVGVLRKIKTERHSSWLVRRVLRPGPPLVNECSAAASASTCAR